MKHHFQIILLILLAGCSPNLYDQIYDIVRNKNKWIENAQKKDYDFTYQRKCFCYLGGEEILIKVREGKIFSATIDSNQEVKINSLPTMRQLFEFILEALKKTGARKRYQI